MPTITIPIEDWSSSSAPLVGGGLLLITVLLDDILGGLLDALDFDIGGVSLMPPCSAFIAMFGVGGIFATQVLDLHGGAAALVGRRVRPRRLRRRVPAVPRAETGRGRPSRSRSATSSATTAPSASRSRPAGSARCYVKAEGQTHEFRATAEATSRPGATVSVTGTAGMGLVVGATPAAGSPPPNQRARSRRCSTGCSTSWAGA